MRIKPRQKPSEGGRIVETEKTTYYRRTRERTYGDDGDARSPRGGPFDDPGSLRRIRGDSFHDRGGPPRIQGPSLLGGEDGFPRGTSPHRGGLVHHRRDDTYARDYDVYPGERPPPFGELGHRRRDGTRARDDEIYPDETTRRAGPRHRSTDRHVDSARGSGRYFIEHRPEGSVAIRAHPRHSTPGPLEYGHGEHKVRSAPSWRATPGLPGPNPTHRSRHPPPHLQHRSMAPRRPLSDSW